MLSESPISPLSIANPSEQGQELPANPLTPKHSPRATGSIVGCHHRSGRWWCQGHEAGRASQARSCVAWVVEEEACSWRWSIAPSRNAASPWQKCSASWTQLRTVQPALWGGQLSGQKAFYPSKYAWNSTDLAPPYNYQVEELYRQCDSCCPML